MPLLTPAQKQEIETPERAYVSGFYQKEIGLFTTIIRDPLVEYRKGTIYLQKFVRNEEGALIPHGPEIAGKWESFKEIVLRMMEEEQAKEKSNATT